MVRERADRSQVAELLTNVRSGRYRIASHNRCAVIIGRCVEWIAEHIERAGLTNLGYGMGRHCAKEWGVLR